MYFAYPYEGGGEIHGFERDYILDFAADYVLMYVGGFFGGKKDRVNLLNGYYSNCQTHYLKVI